MIDIEFKLNGRKIRPSDIGDQLEKAMLEHVEQSVGEKLRGINDPKTGEVPKVTFKGRSFDDLSFEVSGSPELIEEVKRRLQ